MSDERTQRYAEAITPAMVEQFYDDSQVAESLRGFDWQSDVARALMAVADAEQSELRAEVERLHGRINFWIDGKTAWAEAAETEHSRAEDALREAENQRGRAEAAEAKVARVEAEIGRHRAFGDLPLSEQMANLPSVGMVVEAFAVALDGDA